MILRRARHGHHLGQGARARDRPLQRHGELVDDLIAERRQWGDRLDPTVLKAIQQKKLLPVSQLPNIDFPTIQVTAELPGASPAQK